jgi:hypothetical protein
MEVGTDITVTSVKGLTAEAEAERFGFAHVAEMLQVKRPPPEFV